MLNFFKSIELFGSNQLHFTLVKYQAAGREMSDEGVADTV